MSTEKDTKSQLTASALKFTQLMPINGDRELILLKGHLLVEELLTEALRLTIPASNPVAIQVTDNMPFASKLNLCWAMLADKANDLDDRFWTGVKLLNNIRNKMSHSIQPKGIDEKITEFIQLMSDAPKNKNDHQHEHELVLCISKLYLKLVVWIEMANIQQERPKN